MKKILTIFLALLVILSILNLKNFEINDNLISSIKSKNQEIEHVFNTFNNKNYLNERIFVSIQKEANDNDINELIQALKRIGYNKKEFLNTEIKLDIKEYINLLPIETLNNIFSEKYLTDRCKEIISFSNLPGTSNYFNYVLNDPLGINFIIFNYFLQFFSSQEKTNTIERIIQFTKSDEIKIELFSEVYDLVKSKKDKFYIIGNELYKYENYLAVKRDIKLCVMLSLIINILIFIAFIRNIKFLILLILGSVLSYLTGLLFVSLFYTSIFAIVIAFTSTFISFNNEYLVHFSGLNTKTKKMNYIGLTSAIGTTFIGFVFLLFAESVIIKQTAIITLGGMLGFLLFLYINLKSLQKMTFHCYEWKLRSFKKSYIIVIFSLSLIAILITPKLNVNTEISTFKFESFFLEKQRKHFENKKHFLNLRHTYAIKINNSPYETFLNLKNEFNNISYHPFDLYKSKPEQLKSSEIIRDKLPHSINFLNSYLLKNSLKLNLINNTSNNKIIDDTRFIQLIGNILGFNWIISLNNNKYLVFSSEQKIVNNSTELIDLSPQIYYNNVLTNLTKQMLILTIISSIFMFFYLLFVQKNIFKVLYIFTPLIISFSIFKIFLIYTNISFNIIHMMGWAIVLTLGTDYTSVSVSWNHNKIELNKILLTGLSSCCSFSILMFAQSPLLFSLGVTVFIGTSIPLLFSVLLKANYNE